MRNDRTMKILYNYPSFLFCSSSDNTNWTIYKKNFSEFTCISFGSKCISITKYTDHIHITDRMCSENNNSVYWAKRN